jgi:hypothetical protein
MEGRGHPISGRGKRFIYPGNAQIGSGVHPASSSVELEALHPEGKSSSHTAPLQWVNLPHALILLNIHDNFFSASREIIEQELPVTAL